MVLYRGLAVYNVYTHIKRHFEKQTPTDKPKNPQHYFESHRPLRKRSVANEQKGTEKSTDSASSDVKTALGHHKTGEKKKS